MITEIDVLLAQKGNKEAFSRLVKALELPMYRVARPHFFQNLVYENLD